MNEILRRALFRARLAEEDVAARLGVDPKTVRRWLEGRVPYPRHRWALADVLGADEDELWPDIQPARTVQPRPEEIKAVYPHRWAIPHRVWHELFASAEAEIDVLAYSGLFLAEDAGLLDVLASKAREGVRVRIALGDPESPQVAERGAEENIGGALAAKIRNALTLCAVLRDVRNAEIRLHRTTLYNSIYRSDDDLFVNQHAYGISASDAPVFHLHKDGDRGMFNRYVESLERVWLLATPLA